MRKFALFDNAILNRGNKFVDQNIDKILLDPVHRAKTLQSVGKRPGFLGRLNPVNWAKQKYLRDPRAQAHIRNQMMARIKTPGYLGKMFGREMGDGEAVLSAIPHVGNLKQRALDPRTWRSAFVDNSAEDQNMLQSALTLARYQA